MAASSAIVCRACKHVLIDPPWTSRPSLEQSFERGRGWSCRVLIKARNRLAPGFSLLQHYPTTWTRPAGGMTMDYVPAGEFLMGSSGGDPGAQDDELPQHTVFVDAFWIDRTEVSNGQYRLCVEAGACQEHGCWDDERFNAPEWYIGASQCVRREFIRRLAGSRDSQTGSTDLPYRPSRTQHRQGGRSSASA